jgi:hypothetical protein
MSTTLHRLIGTFLILAGLAGCGDDSVRADPTCCGDLYPTWCERFAQCDPLTFGLSWRDAAACTAEQVPACERGNDGEALCTGRDAAHTDACAAALADASCDDLFGSAGLPRACR